jgi:hypothetical protein
MNSFPRSQDHDRIIRTQTRVTVFQKHVNVEWNGRHETAISRRCDLNQSNIQLSQRALPVFPEIAKLMNGHRFRLGSGPDCELEGQLVGGRRLESLNVKRLGRGRLPRLAVHSSVYTER